MELPILSIITFLPLLGVPLLALVPRSLGDTSRNVTLAFMAVTFAAALHLFHQFDGQVVTFQFREEQGWIPPFISYRLGVDGISLLLVLLTTFLTPLALLGAFRSVKEKVKEFCICLLVLETAMLGTFMALDLFLFFLFWELMLLPMFLVIGIWGGRQRVRAALKFVLFSMVGSLLMLVAILYMFFKHGGSSFAYEPLLDSLTAVGAVSALSFREQLWLFGAFGLAFAIKVPLFPLHSWLPEAQVEAPAAGSALMAGVMLKAGTYGFLRLGIPFFPEAAALCSGPLMGLAAVGIIYGALQAMAQRDVKRLVAYANLSHLGMVMLGIFAMTREGIEGSLLAMVSHGLTIGALFLCVGFLHERRDSRLMSDYGGIARQMPLFATFFMIVVFSAIGLPGTSGFVSEFLVLTGVFKEGIGSVLPEGSVLCWRNLVLATGLLAVAGIFLGAVYMLSMVRKVMFGPMIHEENRALRDLNGRERTVLLLLVAMILAIGVAPAPFVGKMRATVDHYADTYQSRITKKRDPATAERRALQKRQLMELQMLNQWRGRPTDLRQLNRKLRTGVPSGGKP